MGRFVLLELLLFFAPMVLFLVYVRVFHKKRAIEALNKQALTILIAVGLFGATVGAFYLSSLDDSNVTGKYVPATIDDGSAHIE